MNYRLQMISLLLLEVGFVQGQKTSEPEMIDYAARDSCTFKSTGRNDYFILEPGYELLLEGKTKGKTMRLVITVKDETRLIDGIETRVVEEKESLNGQVVEVSRNYFAVCQRTGSVFYFGEEVDIYKKGKIVSHDGAWIAGEKNKAGIIMPGNISIGLNYYQEQAPGIAMDKAKVIGSVIVETPSGRFEKCIKMEESNALSPGEKEYKYYAPGIGLVKEENLLLIKHGFIK